ncbi:MAG: hypothetical protein MnENMB40S_01230 [Rhizobiaceae bacterium MnEN-MB40S]|nr:MAG: hypothetical protein MnENMB40S_01230 [Rhizobiaceae bacterium MnEN-MB40S]
MLTAITLPTYLFRAAGDCSVTVETTTAGGGEELAVCACAVIGVNAMDNPANATLKIMKRTPPCYWSRHPSRYYS